MRTSYLLVFFGFAAVLFLGHASLLSLPFFWDELGQFVPAALDIFHHGWLVPQSAIPNVHPPGVPAALAAVWELTGYSIVSTRSAMLLLAAGGLTSFFLLAILLCRRLPGAPAFAAAILILVDPLFFTQSMMAQLDMPAMALTMLVLGLFLEGKHRAAAVASVGLVMAKETGVLLPVICAAWLLVRGGSKRTLAGWYALPVVALSVWLVYLHAKTGNWLGDPGFAHYNVDYAMNPIRALASFGRRAYYLFIAGFRWIGSILILVALRSGSFRTPEWRFSAVFAGAHVIAVSLLGGAELERYLLPVLPIFYIAVAAALTVLAAEWRAVVTGVMAIGLLMGLFLNPPYPFPFENNLAMADFVNLHATAARYLEGSYPGHRVFTAWPLTGALRTPEFGYVHRGFETIETSDFHQSSLAKLDPASVDVMVLYSRTWEPEKGILHAPWVRDFLGKYFDYQPQMSSAECSLRFGLRPVIRWQRHGQWIEILAKPKDTQSPGDPKSIAYHKALEGSSHEQLSASTHGGRADFAW